ncbi:MAG: FAD-dependent monooxygenase [Devosiaceae bacterium]|nr:FAD-dependent monooxygenase [Devosiaceae bacterium]
MIYIAGAGIAGMTLALALAKLGVKAVIIEKTKGLQPEGAGLQISPNARHVLNQLGLSSALHGLGFSPQAIDIYPFKRAKPLKSLKLGPFAQQRFDSPYIVIHRADLADILYKACQQSNLIEIHFGITGFDMITHANGLSVSREHSDGHIHEANPFAFVGADGVHSVTRTKILSGPDASYSGYTAWRALIPTSMMKAELNLFHTSLLWGPGFHAVAYPHPRRHVINIALFSKEKLGANTGKKSVAPNLPKIALTCPRFNAIIESSEGEWTNWPLYGVKTGRWHKGPVGLIGDAAHAMLPFQAQGAAMAIEDAATLAPLLANANEPQTAFATYYAERKNRVRKIISISASNGEIYHMGAPFSYARDLVVLAQGTTGHLRRLAWIYDHKIPI